MIGLRANPWPENPLQALATKVNGVHGESFTVRWTGDVVPLYSETYTFYTVADDGVRLRVNGQTLVNDWNTGSAREESGTIALEAGRPYSIEVEYLEHVYWASISLSWSSASQPQQVVPRSQLFSTAASTTARPHSAPMTLPVPL